MGASALFCVEAVVAFAERLVDPGGRPLRTAEGNPKNACTASTWDVVVGSAVIAEQTDGCTAACCNICAAAVALSDATAIAVAPGAAVGLTDASAISFLPKVVAGVVNGSALAGVVGCLVVLKIIIFLSFIIIVKFFVLKHTFECLKNLVLQHSSKPLLTAPNDRSSKKAATLLLLF